MERDYDATRAGEQLTELDRTQIKRLLELEPSSTQLIAALHAVFASESRRMPPAAGRQANDRSTECLQDALWPEPTLHERARLIDPCTAGLCRAAWGEWITPRERQVNLALCWYPFSDQVDFVPDWAMREAWPEHASCWDALVEQAWEGHQVASPQCASLPVVAADDSWPL